MTIQYKEDPPNLEERTDEKEAEFMKSMVGKKVTAATFDPDEGYMIEIDDVIRFRSCGAHTVIYRRKIQ